MGAEFLTVTFSGHYEAHKVQALVEDMINESQQANGGNSYTGTWGEATADCGIHSQVFESSQAAEEFLINTAKKWGRAEAVRYKSKPSVPKESLCAFKAEREKTIAGSKRIKALKARQEKALASYNVVAEALRELRVKINEHHAALKSKTVKCSGCGSSIAKQYIKYQSDSGQIVAVPLQNVVYSPTIMDSLSRYALPICPVCDGVVVSYKGGMGQIKRLCELHNKYATAWRELQNQINTESAEINERLLKKYKATDGIVWMAAVWAAC